MAMTSLTLLNRIDELERENEALREAASRVVRKYGVAENGEPLDWTEWQDLRDALGRENAAFDSESAKGHSDA